MDRALFLAAAAVVVMLAAAMARRANAGQMPQEITFDGIGELLPSWGGFEPDQSPNILESAVINFDPSTYTPANVAPDVAARNERAFLDMVAYAEGTAGRGDDGYNILFGYGRFDSYADHPRIYVPFGDTTTSAAGRYQILARTWDGVRGRLGLPDFSPASQDAAAIELIRERGALNDVRAGRVTTAIEKVRKVWASLPGAGYGQPERRLSSLLDAYASAGGSMEHQA
ncbi:glycoside hydrolase family 24 protein [Diaphorobacter nitroreducens]|uniref:glycoside hydrolase family 24 protein n=1 Tax=Diaphorobacter nitroreducens TaxID=164759 RepID=UPI0035E3E2F5